MSSPDHDLSARISGLFIYPVKSCAGIALSECALSDTGLAQDRGWMVVDALGEFITQRQLPRMALIHPQLADDALLLRAPGMAELHVGAADARTACKVRLWDDQVQALDAGDAAARWFSEFLGQALRLVRFDPQQRRLSSRSWTGDFEALNAFSDGFPLLLIGEASVTELNRRLGQQGFAPVGMERFRPNIVLSDLEANDEDHLDELQVTTASGEVRLRAVKPCPRCPIPNIDPQTGISSPEVGDALQVYRRNARVKGAASFGMNLVLLHGQSQVLRIGQQVAANYRFDE